MAGNRSSTTRAVHRAEAIPSCPHRRLFVATAGVIALAGTVGTAQLLTGTLTPPISDLDRLGLTSWVLPGLWLFAVVVVPWTIAAWASARRWTSAPVAVIVAASLLALELGVQIPFLGLSPFQPVMGALAIGSGLLAWHDQPRWGPHPPTTRRQPATKTSSIT